MQSFDNVIFTITSFSAKKIRKNNIAERKMKKKKMYLVANVATIFDQPLDLIKT